MAIRSRLLGRGAALLLAGWCLMMSAVAGAVPGGHPEMPALQGLSLLEALQVLESRGLHVVFSSRLVRDSMRVETEPRGATPREVLDELLRPHGLRVQEGARGRLVIVPAAPVAVVLERKSAPPPPVSPPRFEDRLVVTPGDGSSSPEPVTVSSLDRAEAAEMPHLGDDLLRSVGVLPGTSARETSSRVSTVGGRDDEVLILLDGLELMAPYHLQDFDSALSIVAPTAVQSAQLITSGYPAEYGDRLGGVLDLTTAAPSESNRLGAGVGMLYADLSGSGFFDRGRGGWHTSLRSGSYRLALELDDRRMDPRFWDGFGKVDYELREGHNLRLRTLIAEDDFGLAASSPDGESYGNRWENNYLWLGHSGLLRPDLLVETIASAGEVERRRNGRNRQAGEEFAVADTRALRLAGIKQIWSYEPAGRFSLEGGFELRQLDSAVEYSNERRLSGALAPLRARPSVGSTRFDGHFDFNQASGFLSSRLRPLETVTVELGLRHDQDSLTREAHTSPRFNLGWTPRPRSVVRFAWGWFYQSQRPNELQVEDDETEIGQAELAEHRVLDFEHRFGNGGSLLAHAFERRISRSRARYENLFDPVTVFPELAEDRIRIEPGDGEAEGFEVGYRSAVSVPFSWWLSYAFSTAEEEIDGRLVPLAVDQTHGLRAGWNFRTRRGWNFNALWQYHTGWPTTAVSGRLVTAADGLPTVVPVLGPLNGERLSPYHRLDLRVGRSWSLSLGRLSAYVDLQNLYDRDNVRGFTDFAFEVDPQGRVVVRSEALSWGGLLPSFGIRWEM